MNLLRGSGYIDTADVSWDLDFQPRSVLARHNVTYDSEERAGPRQAPTIMAGTDDDPASAASDAHSLHTIADQANAYAAQERSDADFALALQLADE
jgi:hypothetical protein